MRLQYPATGKPGVRLQYPTMGKPGVRLQWPTTGKAGVRLAVVPKEKTLRASFEVSRPIRPP